MVVAELLNFLVGRNEGLLLNRVGHLEVGELHENSLADPGYRHAVALKTPQAGSANVAGFKEVARSDWKVACDLFGKFRDVALHGVRLHQISGASNDTLHTNFYDLTLC